MHFLPFLSIAAMLLPPTTAGSASALKELYRFPNQTVVENIAVRPNGELLITTFGPGCVYVLDPNCANPTPRRVFEFPRNSSTGIAQIAPDRFAVVSGDVVTEKYRFVDGTVSVLITEFNGTAGEASIINVIPAPIPAMVNGLANLPYCPGSVLAAGSSNGRILRFDAESGEVEVVLEDALLAPVDGALYPLGVNGIKVFEGYLYCTNTALNTIGRVAISADGKQFGNFEQVASLEPSSTATGYDDFDVDILGSLYVSRHLESVVKFFQDGQQVLFVNSTLLLNPTSTALSKEKSLYITTFGGQIVEASI